jgi:hypothetical protein
MSCIVPTTLRTVRRTTTYTNFRLFATTPATFSGSQWTGRQGDEHVLNRKDSTEHQSRESMAGMAEKQKDNATGKGEGSASATKGGSSSGATSERDAGENNKRAKEDNPEAPGPVLGMNDERGGVSATLLVF